MRFCRSRIHTPGIIGPRADPGSIVCHHPPAFSLVSAHAGSAGTAVARSRPDKFRSDAFGLKRSGALPLETVTVAAWKHAENLAGRARPLQSNSLVESGPARVSRDEKAEN